MFCPDCEYAQTTVLAAAGDVGFKATGRTILQEGWRTVYAKGQDDDGGDEQEDGGNGVLPAFSVGESGRHEPSLLPRTTTPPKRYTEASLLQAMETAGRLVADDALREAMKENGIGRPSSRAAIIETLLKRGYVRREKKSLVSSPAGRNLIGVIQARLLKSQFMDELQSQLVCIIKEVQTDATDRKITSQSEQASLTPATGRTTNRRSSSKKVKAGDRCPLCSKGYVRKGPYGLFCSEYKNSGCKFKQKA